MIHHYFCHTRFRRRLSRPFDPVKLIKQVRAAGLMKPAG